MSSNENVQRSTPGCRYATLGTYEQGQQLVAIGKSVPSMSQQVVPLYPNINYDTLAHNMKHGCGGYFDVQVAYPGMQGDDCNTKFAVVPACGPRNIR